MAGHSKWANIKRRKGAQDAARGKRFTKLIKEIMVAARLGGGDESANPRLRLAIEKARAASMPKDNIKRAIDKATGNLEGADYEEYKLEGYGPGGIAVLVEVMTDNRNRAAAEIRHAFNKSDGNLGTSGCVAYMFQKKGVMVFEAVDEDELLMAALDAGAEDVQADGEAFEVTTEPTEYLSVKDALRTAGLEPGSAELSYVPDNRVEVAGKDAESVLRLLDLLEDCDDVQAVHHNADISDEELGRILG